MGFQKQLRCMCGGPRKLTSNCLTLTCQPLLTRIPSSLGPQFCFSHLVSYRDLLSGSGVQRSEVESQPCSWSPFNLPLFLLRLTLARSKSTCYYSESLGSLQWASVSECLAVSQKDMVFYDFADEVRASTCSYLAVMGGETLTLYTVPSTIHGCRLGIRALQRSLIHVGDEDGRQVNQICKTSCDTQISETQPACRW